MDKTISLSSFIGHQYIFADVKYVLRGFESDSNKLFIGGRRHNKRLSFVSQAIKVYNTPYDSERNRGGNDSTVININIESSSGRSCEHDEMEKINTRTSTPFEKQHQSTGFNIRVPDYVICVRSQVVEYHNRAKIVRPVGTLLVRK